MSHSKGKKSRGRAAAGPSPPAPPTSSAPRKLLLASALSGLSLLVYLETLYPSVAGGDATEFAAHACQFGVPHPPGYPTFTALAHLFYRFFPWGTPAERANAAAAFCGAAAAGMTFLSVEAATGSEPAALGAAGLFAFGRLVWTYSIQSEVFALNHLLTAALFYLAACYDKQPRDAIAYWGAVLCGLGATNQHTLVFYAGPLAVFVLWRGRASLFTPRKVLLLSAVALGGITGPYLLLAWRSSKGLPGSWGDLSSLQGILTHLLRREYGTFKLSGDQQTSTNFVLGMKLYLGDALREHRLEGAALAALGCAAAAAPALPGAAPFRSLAAVRLAGLCWVLYTLAFHSLADIPIADDLLRRGIHARFWMQSHHLAAHLTGAGAAALASVAGSELVGTAPWRLGHNLPSYIAVAAIARQIGFNLEACDQSRNHLIHRLGLEMLRSLPHGALYIVRQDHVSNTVRYLQVCEGYREDVQVVDQHMLTRPWFVKMQTRNFPRVVFPGPMLHLEVGYSMKQFLDANRLAFPEREVYLGGGWNMQDPSPHEVYELLAVGVNHKVHVRGGAVDFNQWLVLSREATRFRVPPDEAHAHGLDTWEHRMVLDHYFAVHERAFVILRWCDQNGPDADALLEAADEIERVQREFEHAWPEMDRNLGVIREMLSKLPIATPEMERMAVDAFRTYLQKVPEPNNKNDHAHSRIRELVTQHDGAQRRPDVVGTRRGVHAGA